MPDTITDRKDDLYLPDRINAVQPLDLCGELNESAELSGAVVVGDYLIVGADEGHQLQILLREPGGDRWCLHEQTPLAKQDQETDIEAITFGDGHVFVVGSHSFRRRLMKPELSRRKNRERLLDIRQDPSRCRLHRLRFDPQQGRAVPLDHINLSKRLKKDPILKRFWGIPSKENGIDIEGVAYRDGLLYLGFRGPVLRENYVPLMVLDYAQPKSYRLKFVRLQGQGIRDMVALDEGFLILSGPVNDAPGPFRLWWWDGADQIPGRDRTIRPALLLGPVSTGGGANAEGLALVQQDGNNVRVVVVYETGNATQAVSMQVSLPDAL